MAVQGNTENKLTKQKLVKAIKSIEMSQGSGTVFTLGSDKAILNIPRWSTGIESLDNVLGGGIPYGRMVEIFGAESAGKTTLLYHLLGRHKVSADIPIEGTFDATRAKIMGCGKGLVVARPKYGEQALEAAMAFSEACVPVIGIDSVPHLITRKMFEEVDMEKEAQRGRIAELITRQMPKLRDITEANNVNLIFINQLRDSMNAMPFAAQTHTPGGRMLRHAMSIRLQLNKLSEIKIPNKDPRNSAKDQTIGIQIKVKVVKSKVHNPYGECILSLIFDTGFVSNDDVAEIRKERMRQNTARYKKIEKVAADYGE